MDSGRQLTKVKIVAPDDDSPCLYLEDEFGLKLCQINHDDSPEEVMHAVASCICHYAGIEFEGLF